MTTSKPLDAEALSAELLELHKSLLLVMKQRDAWSRLARARGQILTRGATPDSADRAQKAADALERLGVNPLTGRKLRRR